MTARLGFQIKVTASCVEGPGTAKQGLCVPPVATLSYRAFASATSASAVQEFRGRELRNKWSACKLFQRGNAYLVGVFFDEVTVGTDQ